MGRFKKLMVMTLVLVFSLSGGFVPKRAMADANPFTDAVRDAYVEGLEDLKVEAELEEVFAPTDEVRVIVELASAPGITVATARDVSYSSLSASDRRSIENKLKVEQAAVKAAIAARSISMEYLNDFVVAFNGFSGLVEFRDIEIIERLSNVKKVTIATEYERPEPMMNSSNDMVQAPSVWETGIKGEGQVIAILDTGIDYRHKDMVLSPGVEGALSAAEVEALGLLGKFFTEKVPYGYNYYDLNFDVIDGGPDPSMHGMHVAGTAGANGEIKGVAPEAQLLAMKVFSNDPIYATTFSDIYLKAIDESIILGADAVNMSLGSTAAFYMMDSPEDRAIKYAVDNGVVVAVSAGNSAQMTSGFAYPFAGYSLPWATNPDIGVTGSPGLNAATISVASVDNTMISANILHYFMGEVEVPAAMSLAGPSVLSEALPDVYEYAYGGLGAPEELGDVEGKVALISRGAYPFVDKINNAYEAGAIAVIIFNNAGEGLINMAYPPGLTIPAGFIGQAAGVAMRDAEVKQVRFPEGSMSVPNPTGGQMSSFTSWGTTPSLDMKPEITAPGGSIYSTMNNNTYGTMSGTSMAAPHVAGGSSLVLQYLKDHDKLSERSEGDLARLAKVLLMNTADPLMDIYGVEYSPRRQGAGLMNVSAAVNTPVVLYNTLTKEAKVELRDFQTTSFTMRLTAENFGDVDVEYAVDVIALRDDVFAYGANYLNWTDATFANVDVTAPETVVVPANGTVDFAVTVDISEDTILTGLKNQFVEGFVQLMDVAGELPNVTVPYIGFYGEWGQPPILDGFRFQRDFGPTYFNTSGFLREFDGGLYFYDSPSIFMSPGTENGAYFGFDTVLPIFSFMRGAENITYRITDADGKVLRTILGQSFARKSFVNQGNSVPYRILPAASWDGTVGGNVLPDGKYFYEVTAKVHYAGAKPQTYKVPINIDTTAPEVTFTAYDNATRTLTFKATDAGSGLNMFEFLVNDVLVEGLVINAVAGKDTYSVVLPEAMPEKSEVTVVAYDRVYNSSHTDVKVPFDAEPFIYILLPDLLEVYDESPVHFHGYVTNFSYLKTLLIDGNVEAEFTFVEDATIMAPGTSTVLYRGPAYEFMADLELEDGYQTITVEAIAENGAKSSLARRFFLDTTAPELAGEVLARGEDAATATIRLQMNDNLSDLVLYEGDNQIFSYLGTSVSLSYGPAEATFDYEVELDFGMNTFAFRLVDIAGHEATYEVSIERLGAENITVLAGSNRYGTAVAISQAEFESATDVIIANGLNYPDALAGAVLSGKLNAPILLVAEHVGPATLAEIERLGAQNIHILGGLAAVNADVEKVFADLGYNVERFDGVNRYDTAVKIGEVVMDGSAVDTAILTFGNDFPDTLMANPYAVENNYPILFTGSDTLQWRTKDALEAWNIKNVTIVGGENVISAAVVAELEAMGITVERVAAQNREHQALAIANGWYPDATTVVIANGYDFADALVGGSMAGRLGVPVLFVKTNAIDPAVLAYLEANIETVIVLGGPAAVSYAVREAIANATK